MTQRGDAKAQQDQQKHLLPPSDQLHMRYLTVTSSKFLTLRDQARAQSLPGKKSTTKDLRFCEDVFCR